MLDPSAFPEPQYSSGAGKGRRGGHCRGPESPWMEALSGCYRAACFYFDFLIRRLDTKKAGRFFAGPLSRLEARDVRSLQALWTPRDFEFNSLALVQRLVSLSLNRREMNENIFARLALDEPKTLAGVEPLHCSLFSH